MIKTGIFSALFLAGGLLVNAQTTGSQPSDTTHHHMMHRDGWARGPQGGRWNNGGPRGGFVQGHSFGQGHSFAQGHGFAHRGGMGIRYTPDQRKQMMAIETDYRHKQADLYKQDNLTLGAYKAQLVALNKEKKTKLKALLTPEQQQQIAQRKTRASDNAQVMEAAHLERMKINLQLSDDQASKLKAQDLSFRTQAQGIRENDDLLPEQKRDQMQSLFAKQKDAIASILTPDQQAKLKTEHQHFGGGFRRDGGRGFHRPDGGNAPAAGNGPAAGDGSTDN